MQVQVVEEEPKLGQALREGLGQGIPPQHRIRIFERFYRVDKARTRAEDGNRLRLSIAEWAVTVNGGWIEVQTGTGQRFAFRISLPRKAPVDHAE